jgi:hypothetical protein
VNEWLKHLEDRFNALVLGKARASWYVHRTKVDGDTQIIPATSCLVVGDIEIAAGATLDIEGELILVG